VLGERATAARAAPFAHRRAQQREAAAAVHHDLAAEQVERLDAMRALVDHVEAVVAPVLLDREIARVAVAAEDLDREAVRFEAPLARPALRDRGQHLEHDVRASLRILGAGVQLVDQPRAVELERKARLRSSSSARAASA
jgi:hypothetical protein